MEIKISFIIPAYNAEKYIERCLKSILRLNEEYKIEVIIVDDGSIDNTAEICERIKKKEPRVVYIKKKNGGVSSARNQGIISAKGDYIFFVDADDEVEIESFDNLYNKVLFGNIDIIMFEYISISKNQVKVSNIELLHLQNLSPIEIAQRYIDYPIYLPLNMQNSYLGAKVYQYVINRNLLVIEKLKFPENIHFAEDMCFMYTVMQYAKSICFINKAYYKYYIIDTSVSHSYRKNFTQEMMEVYNYIVNVSIQNIDTIALKLGVVNTILKYYSRFMNYKNYNKEAKKIWDLLEKEKFIFENLMVKENYICNIYIKAIIKKNILVIYLYNKYIFRIIKLACEND